MCVIITNSNMFIWFINYPLVYFIGHYKCIPLLRKISNELQFFPGENFTYRIMGSIDNYTLCFFIEQTCHFFLIEYPIAGGNFATGFCLKKPNIKFPPNTS